MLQRLQSTTGTRPEPCSAASRYTVALARSVEEVRAAQALRHLVFAGELGARLQPGPTAACGLDVDYFDGFCEHLLVRDVFSQEVVGTYRILPPANAALARSYYSESEFDLSRLSALRDELVELGRSCVHPDHRTGAVMTLLWAGIAAYMRDHGYRYLMGCASISTRDGGHQAASLYRTLCDNHSAPSEWRVFPKRPLPLAGLDHHAPATPPPLLKGYMRVGAYICGEPAWDADFNTADLFLLLPMERMSPRYASHFTARQRR